MKCETCFYFNRIINRELSSHIPKGAIGYCMNREFYVLKGERGKAYKYTYDNCLEYEDEMEVNIVSKSW